MLKCFLYLCLFRLISSDKSFTVILDTTSSMQDEIDIIKVNLPSAINAFNNTDVSDYIIVPFNDPDVGEPIISHTRKDFVTSLNAFSTSGGRECPENSLAGIERALQISKPQSYIFLFTDAYSKDASKLGSVQHFCRNTRSQVIIFLTGYCISSPDINVQVYYDVARACSGAVLRLESATLRQALRYITEVISVQWTDVMNYETFTDYKQLIFSADLFTKTVLLEVSGENPTVEITTPDGSRSGIEKILDFRHTQVLRLATPSVGEYTVRIRCHGITSATLYKKYELPLRFGFSTKLPRSMSETSTRPLPGRTNYILLDVSQSKMKLEKVEIQYSNEQEKKTLTLEEHHSTGFYWTQFFVAPEKPFRIWIKGYDKSSYQEIKGSTDVILPQQTDNVDTRWTKPNSVILDGESITVDFGTNATPACKVMGYPTPSISWRDDNGVSLPSEKVLLEIPSLHISYVSLENVTVNTTINCISTNSEGEDSKSLKVYVFRPFTFEVMQTPIDQTIEYGSEGKLYCEVSAYPPAEIKWYHNDTEVIFSDGIEILPEYNALWIKNMTVDTIGEYKCEMKNDGNTKTYNAFVKITGIEAPEIEVDNANVVVNIGDWSYLQCRILKGKPSPTITWTYKTEDGYEFGLLPEGVEADFDKLKIASTQSTHKGIYRCSAENIMGQHYSDITVELQFPPLIKSDDVHSVTVKEDEDVELTCDVEASPAARVRWEMSQGDVFIVLDSRHRTDHRNTHRFKAFSKDSGNYHCIAENNIGRAEKTITVNVLVPPYIQAPNSTTVVARVGENILLQCNVLYGNPVPSTMWKFIALDSTSRVLSKHNSSRPLYLNNVSNSNEGSYFCIADNVVGTDNIQIYVKIQ